MSSKGAEAVLRALDIAVARTSSAALPSKKKASKQPTAADEVLYSQTVTGPGGGWKIAILPSVQRKLRVRQSDADMFDDTAALQVIAPDSDVLVTRRAVQTKLMQYAQVEMSETEEPEEAAPESRPAVRATAGVKKKKVYKCGRCGMQKSAPVS